MASHPHGFAPAWLRTAFEKKQGQNDPASIALSNSRVKSFSSASRNSSQACVISSLLFMAVFMMLMF